MLSNLVELEDLLHDADTLWVSKADAVKICLAARSVVMMMTAPGMSMADEVRIGSDGRYSRSEIDRYLICYALSTAKGHLGDYNNFKWITARRQSLTRCLWRILLFMIEEV